MRTDLLEILRCPNCGGKLEVASAGQAITGNELQYGLLVCGCGEYPVVAGVPVVKVEGRLSAMKQTRDSVLNIGPRISDLVSLIRKGRHEEALLRLLVIPNRSAARLLAMSDTAPVRAQKVLEKLAGFFWSRQCRQRKNAVLAGYESATGLDMIRFFYHVSLQAEVGNYFGCRFGQPRHLAALSLARLFSESDGPILDLACGFGHLMHYWSKTQPNRSVIGLDRNFFQLYVAKRWIAPRCDFICAEADFRLPLADESIAGAFCSDAFHCFLRRALCAQELDRVTHASALVILARVGNRLVEPREGYEMTADEYSALFKGSTVRVFSEDDLLTRYLNQLGPDLQHGTSDVAVTKQKWLSLVVAKDPEAFHVNREFQSWPHAVGRLKLNPLYQTSAEEADGVNLTLTFPSSWYEFENSECLRYMPKTIRLKRSVLADIDAGARTTEIQDLAEKCVVVGMPDRYS